MHSNSAVMETKMQFIVKITGIFILFLNNLKFIFFYFYFVIDRNRNITHIKTSISPTCYSIFTEVNI